MFDFRKLVLASGMAAGMLAGQFLPVAATSGTGTGAGAPGAGAPLSSIGGGTPTPPAYSMVGYRNTKWAIVMCKLNDHPEEPETVQHFQNMFEKPNQGGLFDYWKDVSYSRLDLTGTRVFGWYTMSQTKAQEQQKSRWDKIQDCLATGTNNGVNLNAFDYFVAILNVDGMNAGSAGGKVLLDAGGNGLWWGFNVAAHEMGHAYGLDHSFDTKNWCRPWTSCEVGTYQSCSPPNDSRPGAYCDPWDLMSGMTSTTFFTAFNIGGPGLNGPYVDQLINGPKSPPAGSGGISLFDWNAPPATLSIAALNHPEADKPWLIKVRLSDPNGYCANVGNAWCHYYTIELRRKDRWDQGIPRNTVLIHEVGPDGLSHLVDTLGGPEFLRCKSFVDLANGIRITTLGINAASSTAAVRISRTDPWSNSIYGDPMVARSCSVRPVDFDTDGKVDQTVFRPADGLWRILWSSGGYETQAWGDSDDVPVPGNYLGASRSQVAFFRPSEGNWYIKSLSVNPSPPPIKWGTADDIPVPGDYLGEGVDQLAFFQPATGTWHIKSVQTGQEVNLAKWGNSDDVPVPGDYLGLGQLQVAVYRPSTGTWHIAEVARKTAESRDHTQLITWWELGQTVNLAKWGNPDDLPVPGDYLGLGQSQVALYRPATGTWHIAEVARKTGGGLGQQFTWWELGRKVNLPKWGDPSDLPVPGDYMGLGQSQLAVYRPSTGAWLVAEVASKTIGNNGGQWFTVWELGQTPQMDNWGGSPGDIPI